ncbi:hypothetical protein GCM10009780_40720 [Actinomadura alba]
MLQRGDSVDVGGQIQLVRQFGLPGPQFSGFHECVKARWSVPSDLGRVPLKIQYNFFQVGHVAIFPSIGMG